MPLNPVASASGTMLWLSANLIASFPHTRNCDASHKTHTRLCIRKVPSKRARELVTGSPTRRLLLKRGWTHVRADLQVSPAPNSLRHFTLQWALPPWYICSTALKNQNRSFPPSAFSDTEVGPQTNISMWQNPSILVPAAQENKSEQCCQFLTL